MLNKRYLTEIIVSLILLFSVSALSSECDCVVVKPRKALLVVSSRLAYPSLAYVAQIMGSCYNYQLPLVLGTDKDKASRLFFENQSIDILGTDGKISPPSELSSDESCIDFGYCGLVLACHKTNFKISLTMQDLFYALVDRIPQNGSLVANQYKYWDEINSKLPHLPIFIYLPEEESHSFSVVKILLLQRIAAGISAYNGVTLKVRSDKTVKYYHNDGETVIHEIMNNPHMFGLLNYNFFSKGYQYLTSVRVDGITPDPGTITAGKYPLIRKLSLRFRRSNVAFANALEKYIDIMLADDISGRDGILTRYGLIPLFSKEQYEKILFDCN